MWLHRHVGVRKHASTSHAIAYTSRPFTSLRRPLRSPKIAVHAANDENSAFGPSQVINVIDDLLENSQRDLETGQQCVVACISPNTHNQLRVQAALQQYRNDNPALSWLFNQLLDIVQGNVTREVEWATALRASRARVQQLPPDTDVFSIATELIENTPEVAALAATFEGVTRSCVDTTLTTIITGPLAVATTLTKLGGAVFFCWIFALLTPADAYRLWGIHNDSSQLTTWAAWTAPCVGACLLLVALRQVDDTQTVHPLPNTEDRAMSHSLVNTLGVLGSLAVTGGAALAAGLVFRGAWLDLLTTSVFTPPDMTAVLDPDEAAIMRCVWVQCAFDTGSPCVPSGARLARCCRPRRRCPCPRCCWASVRAPVRPRSRRCTASSTRCWQTPRRKTRGMGRDQHLGASTTQHMQDGGAAGTDRGVERQQRVGVCVVRRGDRGRRAVGDARGVGAGELRGCRVGAVRGAVCRDAGDAVAVDERGHPCGVHAGDGARAQGLGGRR